MAYNFDNDNISLCVSFMDENITNLNYKLVEAEHKRSIFKLMQKVTIKDSEIKATIGDKFLPDFIVIREVFM